MSKKSNELKRLLRHQAKSLQSGKMNRDDRIADHYINGSKLRDDDKAYLEQIEKILELRRKGYSRRNAVAWICTQYNMSKSSAERLVSKTDFFAATVAEFNKHATRHYLTEQLYECLNMAKAANNIPLVVEIISEIAKISGVHHKDVEPPEVPQLPSQIYFVNDIRVLNPNASVNAKVEGFETIEIVSDEKENLSE